MIDWVESVKRDLREYMDKQDAVGAMRDAIEQLDTALTGVGSALKGDTPVRGGGDANDKWLDTIIRKNEMLIDLVSTEARLRHIASAMAGLSDSEREILDKRYIHPLPISEICELMHLESAQVYRRSNQALRRLAIRMYGDGAK